MPDSFTRSLSLKKLCWLKAKCYHIENFHVWVYTFIFMVAVEVHTVDLNLSVEEKGQK